MMENQHQYDVTIDNQSDAYAQIALQGPLAEEVLQSLTSTDVSAIKFFRFQENVEVAGHKVLVSRSGYTGEDGFELYGAPEDIKALWGKF